MVRAVTSWTVVPIVMTFSLSLELLTLVQAWPWSALGHLSHVRSVEVGREEGRYQGKGDSVEDRRGSLTYFLLSFISSCSFSCKRKGRKTN